MGYLYSVEACLGVKIGNQFCTRTQFWEDQKHQLWVIITFDNDGQNFFGKWILHPQVKLYMSMYLDLSGGAWEKMVGKPLVSKIMFTLPTEKLGRQRP